MVHGKMELFMEKEFSPGRIKTDMKDNLTMTKDMVKEPFIGQMEDHGVVCGIQANNMVKEYTKSKML